MSLVPDTSSASFNAPRHTVVYHTSKSGLAVELDYQLPATTHLKPGAALPVVISYHGGALFVGSRRDPMFPSLTESLLQSGVMIVYPDYRLLDPSTCYDELEDIVALFAFLASPDFAASLPHGIAIDPLRVGVVGFSAGCYMARLATVHALKASAAGQSSIKLQAAVYFFGMGGSCFLDYWVRPRPDCELVPVPEHIRNGTPVTELADCPYTPDIPGFHNTPIRAEWCKYWWDTGNFYDLCFGEKGLSARLRSFKTAEERINYIESEPESKQYEDLFPEIFLARNPIAKDWPPTMMVHGSGDPVVPFEESLKAKRQLEHLNVPVELFVVPNGDHDLVDNDTKQLLPEKTVGILEAAKFLVQRLRA